MNNKFRIFFTKIFLNFVMNNPLCTSRERRGALILCGAKIDKKTLIYQNVSILTYFYGIDRKFDFSNVTIGNNYFIGMNSIICKPIRKRDGCILDGGLNNYT